MAENLIITCPGCGAKHRIPQELLEARAAIKCLHCQKSFVRAEWIDRTRQAENRDMDEIARIQESRPSLVMVEADRPRAVWLREVDFATAIKLGTGIAIPLFIVGLLFCWFLQMILEDQMVRGLEEWKVLFSLKRPGG